MKCSRNFEFEKQTDQNFITQNLRHGEEYVKVRLYIYINMFWLVLGGGLFFWVVVCGGRYILAGCGWWWIYFD